MDLLALSDFTLVARHGGFGRAARAAGRPKATLSRRVADLESSLDLRLFERGGRALKLTEEGRALFERTASLLTDLDETAAAIASGGHKPKGRLRVSAPLLFSQTAMGKLAAGFALKYPEVSLEVTTEDRPVDMVEEGYDLVIRVNPSPDESLVGRVILRDRQVVVASPEVPLSTGDAPAPAVIRTGSSRSNVWNASRDGTTFNIPLRPVLHLSSMIMIRDPVRTGAGAACLPISLVSQDIADGRLTLWGSLSEPGIELWALYPSRRLLSARVSAFLDHLKDVFPNGRPEELAKFMG
jgi:DNA-binding transcriptional LysR family regulator